MTRFWLVRHAIVEEASRATYYGCQDVPVCREGLIREADRLRALAERLPQPALWIVTPLSRTQRTAEAIQEAGYPQTPWRTEPGFTEQSLGEWEGLPHAEVAARLTLPAHPFWPLGAEEQAPGGETMQEVILRVGETLERLAAEHPERDVVAVSHGGAIRAAIAHALGVNAQTVLHFAIQNLSLTCLQRQKEGWRVVCVNEHNRQAPEYWSFLPRG